MKIKILLSLIFTVIAIQLVKAQDENYIIKAFYSPHLIHGHTTESLETGIMDFRINHRFGEIKSGLYDFFGMDQATTALSLEYGVNKNIMLGLRRSSLSKTYEAYGKFKILQQSQGIKNMPISLSALINMNYNAKKWDFPERENLESSRYSYTYQLIASSKISDRFSFQIMPSIVHRNMVRTKQDKNDLIALGLGSKIELNHRFAITCEYYLVNHSDSQFTNPLSLGLDIKTGSHIFQLFLTNSTQVSEKGFISETTGRPLDGQIFFGFNISKAFSL